MLEQQLERLQGETGLSGFKARDGRAAFSETEESLFLCSAVLSPSMQMQMAAVNLTNTICWPCSGDSLSFSPTQVSVPPKPFPVVFPNKQLVLTHISDFPGVSQKFTEPKQAASRFTILCISSLAALCLPLATAGLLHSLTFQGTSKPSMGASIGGLLCG